MSRSWQARRTTRLAALCMTAALLSGPACYAYQPVAATPLVVGERVRLQLTPSGTLDLARYLGPRVQVVEGVAAGGRAEDGLIVGVEWVQLADGIRQPWSGEGVVTFPNASIANSERRVLDRRRSTLAGVSILGGVVAVASLALRTGGAQGGGETGSGGPPP